MRRSLAVAAALSTCVSCSLFTSLGGYSADADEPLADGGPSATDGTSEIVEGGGGADAGDAAADGAFRCATADATLCDDFDDANDTTFIKWTGIETDNGGIVGRSDAGYSAPSAFSSKAPFVAGQQVTAHLQKTFSEAKRARVAYRFRLEEFESAALVTIGQLVMVTGTATSSVRLAVGGGAANFEGAIYPGGTGSSGTFPDVTDQFPFGDDAWHSVDMTVDWGVKPAQVTIDYDGRRIADKRALDGSTFGPGSLRITAGLYYREGGNNVPWRLLVDDFAAWVE
jgi:hypothetical protein